MSFSTTWQWMGLLGFKYDDRKKSFYVDDHEQEDVAANRQVFCETYQTKLEPYCKRWVQCSISNATSIKGLDIGLGRSYFIIIRNEEVVEFHINYWNQHYTTPPSPPGQETQPTIQPTTSI
jgi:hypothetical protein